jgi:GTP cyclohydrolase I
MFDPTMNLGVTMTSDSPTYEDAVQAIRTLLHYIGEDPDREGLLQTPARVVAAWETEWAAGYRKPEFPLTTFDNTTRPHDQMVIIKDIAYTSRCEHHLEVYWGEAHIAYLPDARIVGLSKLARIVKHFAARLTVQERLTTEIADFIADQIAPSCAVSLSAQHMCMISRGVRQPNSKAITTALRGRFLSNPAAQSEFLSMARNGGR